MNNACIVNTCRTKIWGNPVNPRLNMSGGIARRVAVQHSVGGIRGVHGVGRSVQLSTGLWSGASCDAGPAGGRDHRATLPITHVTPTPHP